MYLPAPHSYIEGKRLFYPMACHGMALDITLITTYRIKYSVPNCGVLKTCRIWIEYESWWFLNSRVIVKALDHALILAKFLLDFFGWTDLAMG